MLACVVLGGTREGLVSPRSPSMNSFVGVAAPIDPMGSILIEILHSVEGGDLEQWLEPRNKSPVFAIAHLYLYSLVFIILHA